MAETFERFEELPPEIQLAVLEATPHGLRMAPELSTRIRTLTGRSFARSFCGKPIGNAEFQRFLQMNPLVFGKIYRSVSQPNYKGGTFVVFYGLTQGEYISLSIDVTYSRNESTVSITMDWSEAGGETKLNDFIKSNPNLYEDDILDLYTQWRILSSRRQCIGEDKNYATDLVLRQLDSNYMEYHRGNPNDPYTLFSTFAYLTLHALIIRTPTLPEEISFTVPVNADGLFGALNEEEQAIINQMRSFIDTLYREIRAFFLQLPRKRTERDTMGRRDSP